MKALWRLLGLGLPLAWPALCAWAAGPSQAQLAAIRALSGLSDPVAVDVAVDPKHDRLFGLASNETSVKLIVARRDAAAHYVPEAATAALPNDFGPRYYVETVQDTDSGGFDVQVNSHDTCGIQVEHFKFAQRTGAWRLVGYDRSEPDHSEPCDVNLDSRRLSVNLLTGGVDVRDFDLGRLVARRTHHRPAGAPALAQFDFRRFALWPPSGPHCQRPTPPTQAGEVATSGAAWRVFPRAASIGPSYSGCQVVWAPRPGGGWDVVMEVEVRQGRPVQTWPQPQTRPSADLACAYEGSRLAPGQSDRCPSLVGSLPPGCLLGGLDRRLVGRVPPARCVDDLGAKR